MTPEDVITEAREYLSQSADADFYDIQGHRLVRALVDRLTRPLNEDELFRRLSDALTGGNATTWDEVIHAAERLTRQEDPLVVHADCHNKALLDAMTITTLRDRLTRQQATIELLSSPAEVAALLQGIEDMRAGRVVPLPPLTPPQDAQQTGPLVAQCGAHPFVDDGAGSCTGCGGQGDSSHWGHSSQSVTHQKEQEPEASKES